MSDAHLARALRVEAVARFVEDQQLARTQQRVGDAEPLLHARASMRAPSCRRRDRGRPDRARRRHVRDGCRMPRADRPRRAGADSRGPRGTGRSPGPPTSAPTRGSTERRAVGMGSPSIRISPLVAAARPSSMRIVVVLPEPLGPRKPKTEPLGTVRSRASTARWRPKTLVRPEVWMAASVIAVPSLRSRHRAGIVTARQPRGSRSGRPRRTRVRHQAAARTAARSAAPVRR